MPITNHMLWPVMKLPGSTPEPCKIQTTPTRMAITPATRLPIRTALHYASALRCVPPEGEGRFRSTLLCLGMDSLRDHHLFAGATARLHLRQVDQTNVETLDGQQ